jgi:hypothetical protein
MDVLRFFDHYLYLKNVEESAFAAVYFISDSSLVNYNI